MKKLFFKISDYAASILMGTGALFLVSLIIDSNWNMLIAMITGMLLGMLAILPAVMLFGFISTPFELFPSGMVITMLTGMFTGMICSMMDTSFLNLLKYSVTFSVLSQLAIDMYNLKLRGEVHHDH